MLKTWIDINRNLFEALFLEKWGLFIILTLMVLVASFNIISTLIVTVTSKVHDIGILQSIGVPKSSIRRIFTKQGVFIGALGTFWGLVGGIGIANIMLVSVTERTREIGLRKAVGARRRDILLQFLIEAVVLSVVGGMIGIAIGGGSSLVLRRFIQTEVTLGSVMLAFGVAAGVGIIAGLAPAVRASRLDPITALRYE